MVQPINLVGLGASYPNPGTFVELDFAKGPAAGSGAIRGALLMGNKTSAGSATPDTVVYSASSTVPCATESDVINLFGSGSQLHTMFIAFMAAAGANNTVPLYFLAVTESAGTAASATMTIANNATANGNHRFWCGGPIGVKSSFVDTLITSGDTPTTIATNIVASINAQTRWPITAANTAGVITITHKQKGPEGNWLRVQAAISSNAPIATTTTLTANTFLTSGATLDSNASALATIAGTRFYYIASGDSDATNVGRLVTQVRSQSLPTTGIRQRIVFGSMDTLANTITVATGVNEPRAEVEWAPCNDYSPAELAAGMTAVFATLEMGAQTGVARKNFSLFPASPTDRASWPFQAGRGGAAGAPTTAQITSALQSGISPFTVLPDGSTQFVKGITTYSLNGSNPDYRTRDRHKVTVCDYWCDDVQAMTQLTYGGRDLLPDPVPGGPSIPSTAVTPGIWGGSIKAITEAYGNAGQWSYPPGQPVAAGQTPADVLVGLMVGPQIEPNSPNRMSVQAPLSPVSIADQFALVALQVG